MAPVPASAILGSTDAHLSRRGEAELFPRGSWAQSLKKSISSAGAAVLESPSVTDALIPLRIYHLKISPQSQSQQQPQSAAQQAPLPDFDLDLGLPLDSSPILEPTTTPSPPTLTKRQVSAATTIVVPTTYPGINPGANGGEIAGIVLGSVFGLIIILWLLYTLRYPYRRVIDTSSVVDGTRERSRTKSRRTRSHKTRTRASSVNSGSTEMRERSPPRRSEPRSPRRARETIIIEETRPRSREPPVRREDDIVEVIEENDPPPRVRRERRVSSGYRNVDPDEFGGGGRPLRKVRR